jgi:hypothetical protein
LTFKNLEPFEVVFCAVALASLKLVSNLPLPHGMPVVLLPGASMAVLLYARYLPYIIEVTAIRHQP